MTAEIVALVIAVGVVAGMCDRFGWPTPLVLVVVGAAASFLPHVPDVRLDPDLVLHVLLPPLLYATAVRTSLFDFKHNKTSIVSLSVVLVVFTTGVVGWATWLVLPGVAVAAALALGAVVAPPDAVAAAALGRRLGLPRRVATLLEQESLVNDAAALIALTVAVSALTASPSVPEVAGDFVWAVVGGVLIGGVVAAVLAVLRARVKDPVLDTLISFVAPYLAFLPAEEVHASGVLATVVTGLALAHLSPRVQTASARVTEAITWRTVAFVLENAVFLVIGLQLPGLLDDAADSDLGTGRIVAVCVTVLVATVVARAVFIFGLAGILASGTPRMRRQAWSPRVAGLVSWAGMRGVVTLAAAQLLPEDLPDREVLLLAAFTVVVGSLLIQGSTLPWLVRRAGLPAPDPAEDALRAAELGDAASAAGLRRLDEVATGSEPEGVVERLRDRSMARSHAAWERLGRPLADQETPSNTYARLRMEMLAAEREVVIRARDDGTAPGDVLSAALAAIDVEESLLDRTEELESLARDRALAPRPRETHCPHLRSAPVGDAQPASACEDCLVEGTTWVHLRRCLSCGHVGCCDSSPRRHSRAHFGSAGHPVVVSAEPGEAWRWCWLDEELG
ncbi:cation:proton antiporter domain-containing protein [Blastococcus haudaquaticus]|uniref:Sodium/proton antiporter, CPA1 family n=1 Tax=Blastococcus haudaquaticus TaxID=1938745 RepID=A0A286GIE6_9ACTN|nr:cation:proton antiporter [Blastococcus haudaquaticus]SOD94996.1 sodium/proton antiporter, CPA1 family [Blastococcus haudaquaticus]